MKKVFLISIVVLMASNCFSQLPNWIWARQATGTVMQNAWSVATDVQGNVYATGWYDSTMVFGSFLLPSAGGDDIFLVKYDANGNVIWAKRAGGSNEDRAYSVTTDISGNVYVTGFFASPTITFGTFTLTNFGFTTDIFIVKYDSNGSALWAHNVGGSTGQGDIGESIATDVLGNVYIAGEFYNHTITFGSNTFINADNSGMYSDIFLAKYDTNGNLIWAKNAGGADNENGSSISTDVAGNIYLTGEFSSPTITFGSTTLINSGGFYIAKYDLNGNVVWARTTTGYLYSSGRSVATDVSKNAYVTGVFGGTTIVFGSDTLINFDVSGIITDMFVVKYDSIGNVIWVRKAGGNYDVMGQSISTNTSLASNALSIYVTGRIEGTSIIFDTDTISVPSVGNDPDILFIVEYDFNGNVICASVLKDGNAIWSAVATDNFGNAYTVGEFQNNQFAVGTDTLTLTAGSTFFIAKYNCEGTTVNTKEILQQEFVSIYPNPFTLQTNINFAEEQLNSTIRIIDIVGKEIKTINFTGRQLVIDNAEMKAGIYFVQTTDEKNNVTNKKIIIQ